MTKSLAAALTATLLLASSSVDASSNTWRKPSLLLTRPLLYKLSGKIGRRRNHSTTAALTVDETSLLSSSISNAVFCVRGGGEGNGPCIGIDLGKCFAVSAI